MDLINKVDAWISDENPLARLFGNHWDDAGRWLMWHLVFFVFWIFLPVWACGLLGVIVGILKEWKDSMDHGGITYDSAFDWASDCLPESLALSIFFGGWYFYIYNWIIVALLYPLRVPKDDYGGEPTGNQVYLWKFGSGM
jgi:hypothetical protein